METLKIKRKEEWLPDSQATREVLSPQLPLEGLSGVVYKTYINKQVYSHMYVTDFSEKTHILKEVF